MAPVRLDLALIRRHPELSRRKARDVIEKGQVSLGGAPLLEPGRLVPEQAALRWDPHRKARSRARLSLPALYEDEALIVVDKPAGLLAVPSSPDARDEDTALARVREYVRHLRPRRPYVGVVHRIDRGTSGAMAFALTPQARQGLVALFREHRIERRYVALVGGQPRGEQGVVDLPLHEEYRGGRRRVARTGEPARTALTRWRSLERFRAGALLEIELSTGRQHQIRVHLAQLGLPILGDAVYGVGGAPAGLPRVRRPLLHARVLAFAHPLSGERVRAESPLPDDFRRVLRALRGGMHGPAPTGRARRA
jgi:23S rRNA pseudouridine1911/1915/1917 synthase